MRPSGGGPDRRAPRTCTPPPEASRCYAGLVYIKHFTQVSDAEGGRRQRPAHSSCHLYKVCTRGNVGLRAGCRPYAQLASNTRCYTARTARRVGEADICAWAFQLSVSGDGCIHAASQNRHAPAAVAAIAQPPCKKGASSLVNLACACAAAPAMCCNALLRHAPSARGKSPLSTLRRLQFTGRWARHAGCKRSALCTASW